MSLKPKFVDDTIEKKIQTLEVYQRELALRLGNLFDLKKFCTAPSGKFYEKQYAAISDPSLFVTDTTTRRSGKTTGRVADHIEVALKYPRSNSIYITTTRLNAKKIMFPILCQTNIDWRLGATPNISDLSLGFPNGSTIYLAGVNDSQSIHNFRGMRLKLATLDEAQSMRAYIKELVDDVISPALFDDKGRLRVTGTPGPVPIGYFYDISHSPQWAHHFYSIFDNPFIVDARERLELELKRRGVHIDDPSIQREFFGQWALDINSLVIRYDAEKNHFDDLPTGNWEHVVIADFGFEDADAIAVLAFSMNHPTAYLIEEKITTKQGITALAAQLTDCIQRYKPMKVLGDFGALGTKIAFELQTRFGIPIEAAEKSRKLEYIELLNDSLRTGRFKAKKTSRFAQDSMLLEWDRDNPEKPKISDKFHSDITDCVIYGHRELLHWLWKEAPKPLQPGTPEYSKKEEEDIWESVRAGLKQQKEEENFWSDPFEYDT